ncbi:MAG TPA: helix-turn-helix domain-containing protein [Rhizomicrobium sp.]|jgi:hypothetical protein
MRESGNHANAPSPDAPASVRFSTDALPERGRLPFLREVVGRTMLRLDLEPVPERPFRVDASMRSLPGLDAFWARCLPVRVRRTGPLIADGNDNLVFQWTDKAGSYELLRHEIMLAPRDAILLSCSDPFSITIPSYCKRVTASVPRERLGALLRDPDACLARARRMLASPRSCSWKTAQVALACGFDDVSYFNCKFRQRFGASPRDVRNEPQR